MVSGAKKILIIAEAGVNHNGSLAMALEMVDAAADAGADMIKFQTFKPELGVSRCAEKADYQKDTTGTAESQLEMVRKYELSREAHETIAVRCREAGIEFFSTPFDLPSVGLLLSLGVRIIKIPSGEITNWPLIHRVGATGKPAVMSTGMSAIAEIKDALGVYLLGALNPGVTPDRETLEAAYASPEGRAYLQRNMTLLHCTTQYPVPYEDVNLLAMEVLRDEFGLPVGYSDHTQGIAVSIAAAARGAVVLEKHFTLDRTLPGPDHRASIEPDELRDLTASVRIVEKSLGERSKRVVPSEEPNRKIARKSLTALTDIKKGEVFSWDNLGAKRPGDGVPPTEFWRYLGEKASRDYAPDEQLP